MSKRDVTQKVNLWLSDPILYREDILALFCKQFTFESVETILEIMRSPDAKPALKLKAADMILSRAWGKPPVSIRVSDADKEKEQQRAQIESELEDAEQKSRAVMELVKLGSVVPSRWGLLETDNHQKEQEPNEN